MTYQQAAQAALDVQDACNMGGVARSFAEAVKAVQDMAHQLHLGTDWVNTHPIVQLFADKMVDLARVRDYDAYSRAYQSCKCIAETGDLDARKESAHV